MACSFKGYKTIKEKLSNIDACNIYFLKSTQLFVMHLIHRKLYLLKILRHSLIINIAHSCT